MKKNLDDVTKLEHFIDKYIDLIENNESIFPVDSPHTVPAKDNEEEDIDDILDELGIDLDD